MIQKLFFFFLTPFVISSYSQACVWVPVGDSKIECRSPYRQFFFGDSARREIVLNIALKNAQRQLYKILNEQDVLALMTEDDQMYVAGNTQVIDKMIQDAEAVLNMTNQITMTGDKYAMGQSPLSAFEDGTLSPYPSAYMVGFTVPLKHGIKLPFEKLLKKFSETLPNLEVGSGSIFFGAVLVPQVVEYVAKHSPENNFSDMTGRVVYEDTERHTRVYDVSGHQTWEKLRFGDVSIKAFPTVDMRLATRGEQAIKDGGLQPTVSLAWGNSIYRPENVGSWGVSYSLPTSLSRVPFASSTLATSPLYQGSLLGRSIFTGRLTWGVLKLLDMAHVETAKISWNSSENFFMDLENLENGLERFPLDQLIVNIRWGDFKNRRLERSSDNLNPLDIASQTRVGVNFGLGLFSALGSSSSIMSLLSQGFSTAEDVADVVADTAAAQPLTAQDRARLAVAQAENELLEQSLQAVLASRFVDELLLGRNAGQGLTTEEIQGLTILIQEDFNRRISEPQ